MNETKRQVNSLWEFRTAVLRSGGFHFWISVWICGYAASLTRSCVIFNVPSVFAVIRVTQPFLRISSTVSSALISQTRLLSRFVTSFKDFSPFFDICPTLETLNMTGFGQFTGRFSCSVFRFSRALTENLSEFCAAILRKGRRQRISSCFQFAVSLSRKFIRQTQTSVIKSQ